MRQFSPVDRAAACGPASICAVRDWCSSFAQMGGKRGFGQAGTAPTLKRTATNSNGLQPTSGFPSCAGQRPNWIRSPESVAQLRRPFSSASTKSRCSIDRSRVSRVPRRSFRSMLWARRVELAEPRLSELGFRQGSLAKQKSNSPGAGGEGIGCILVGITGWS